MEDFSYTNRLHHDENKYHGKASNHTACIETSKLDTFPFICFRRCLFSYPLLALDSSFVRSKLLYVSLTHSMATITDKLTAVNNTGAAPSSLEGNLETTVNTTDRVQNTTVGVKKDGEDSKATTVAAPVTDTQKKKRRAERFGMPVQLSEQEKRNSRAER